MAVGEAHEGGLVAGRVVDRPTAQAVDVVGHDAVAGGTQLLGAVGGHPRHGRRAEAAVLGGAGEVDDGLEVVGGRGRLRL